MSRIVTFLNESQEGNALLLSCSKALYYFALFNCNLHALKVSYYIQFLISTNTYSAGSIPD
jgi:hypothetical protein